MIIFDLEWNRGYDKTPLEEILQIGAVRIERMGGPIVDSFCIFIRPCVHKKLNRTAKYLPELQAAMADFFGPESYHLQDYSLYYENLKQNVADRIAAFERK